MDDSPVRVQVELKNKCKILKKVLSEIPADSLNKRSNNHRKNLIELLEHFGPQDVVRQGVSHAFLTKLINCFPDILRLQFQGVCTIDNFDPVKIQKQIGEKIPWFSIINLSTRENLDNGHIGHFVLFLYKKNIFNIFNYMYVDPLGNRPPEDIVNQVEKLGLNKEKLITNQTKIQSSHSNYCGLYNICFILFLIFHNHSLHVLQNFFIENDVDNNNESRAFKYIQRCINQF